MKLNKGFFILTTMIVAALLILPGFMVMDRENSIEEIINDMTKPHDCFPSGVPTYFDWYSAPRINMGNDPHNFTAMTAWGHVYSCSNDSTLLQNTRIQIKNIKSYYLSKKDNKWHLLQNSQSIEGNNFISNYVLNQQKPANIRIEPDLTTSIKLEDGYNFHFWVPRKKKLIVANDINGIFTTVMARLITDNTDMPEDIDERRYILGMGGDYWLTPDAPYVEGNLNNDDIAIGRFKFITREWQSFNMITIGADEIRKNPPPMN